MRIKSSSLATKSASIASISKAIVTRRSKGTKVPMSTKTVDAIPTKAIPSDMACPRKPSARICGYNFRDNLKCTLPAGHDGGYHDTVEKPEVPANVTRELQKVTPITLDFDANVEGVLADVLYGWYKTENDWYTPLEADLAVYSKGLKFENEINNSPAVYALVFMGYMEKMNWVASNRVCQCAKYRLTRKGMEAAKKIALSLGEKPLMARTRISSKIAGEEVDCPKCSGTGESEDGGLCVSCKGQGTVTRKAGKASPELLAAYDSLGVISDAIRDIPFSSQRKTATTTTKVKIGVRGKTVRRKVVDCIQCDGTGEYRGKICSKCKGTGER